MIGDKIKQIIPTLSFNFPYSADEWSQSLLIENYHSHTGFSNTTIMDSPVSVQDYVNRIHELGGKCLFSGEHGSQGNHIEVYDIASKSGLKYVHSTEAYWVKDRHEQDNINCHICIIALNAEARQELNYILSIANEDGYYYRPRLDLELILGLNPKDFIVTSACVAGWSYEDADEIWLKIAKHFGENFFFEVQNHNTTKQKELNQHILSLAKEHNIDIICGLDSHYIYEEESIKRDCIVKFKKSENEDELGWYMDYPSGEEVYRRFVEQDILTKEQILRAMMNTNVFVVKCQEIVLDKHFKIPIYYKGTTYDERVGIFKSLLNERYQEEKLKSQDKIKGIQYEAEQVIDSHVVDYFLTNYHIVKDAVEKEGGVLTPTSRGSAASFIINKLLGFTTMDRYNSEIPIYPERFLTKERVQAGQMPDIDLNIARQEPFVRSARKILGEHGCYPLMAIGYMKEKAAWQLYSKVNGTDPQTANDISKYIDKYNDALKYAEDDEKDFIKAEDYIPSEYVDLYNESKEYQSIIDGLKCHACGHLIFDGDIRREIGLISAVSKASGKRTLVACVEGKYLDDYGYVKDDFLIVDSVALMNECFEAIGGKVPSFDELREMVRNDELTWGIYEKGITCCVNQIEKDSTTQKAMSYKPKNLAELAAFIAGIRPGFASLLPTFLKRESYSTGEPRIDELLEDSYHFMLYQESIMKILSFLDVPMGDSYGVIKSISKKKLKGEKKENLKKQLIQAWKEHFGNTDKFDEVWNVIEDSARYSFNCLSKDTIIYRPSAQKRYKPLTIEEMFLIKNNAQYAKETKHYDLHKKYMNQGYGKALSMFEDNRLHYNSIIDIYDAGVQDVYRVTTETGKTIVCTMEHKFPTPLGKLPLKEIHIGDRLFVKGEYKKEKFDASLTNGTFEKNYPSKRQCGFRKNPDGVSVIFDRFREEKIQNKCCCDLCGIGYSDKTKFSVHHKDMNRKNNNINNFVWLCDSCHKKEHYKNGRTKTYGKGIETFADKIVSIEYIGKDHVYNVSMDDPAHNFVVNDGIITSNSPHALAMAGDSAYLAWFKAHHTSVFYEVAINHYLDKDNKKKMNALTDEAKEKYGYKIATYQYGNDNTKTNVSDEKKLIYPSMSLIKGMQSSAPYTLLKIKEQNPKDVVELMKVIDETKTMSTKKEEKLNDSSLTKLIRIGYFNQFGTINELLIAKEIYSTYGTKKTLKKPCEFDVEGCFGKETAKQYSQLDNLALCRKIFAQHTIPPDSEYALIQNQIEIMGYTMLTIPSAPMNYFALQGVEVNKYGTPFVKLYRLYDGGVIECKMDKKYFEEHPFNKDNNGKFMAGQIMKCAFKSKEKRKKVDGNWVLSGEFEYVLSAYVDVEEE